MMSGEGQILDHGGARPGVAVLGDHFYWPMDSTGEGGRWSSSGSVSKSRSRSRSVSMRSCVIKGGRHCSSRSRFHISGGWLWKRKSATRCQVVRV